MTGRRCLVGAVLLVLAFLSVTSGAPQEAPLDNAQIVKLTKLDMGDDVIIAKIRQVKEANFATSTDDLVKLKEAGVSRAVIAAMIERAGSGSGAPPGAYGGESEVTLRTTEGPIRLRATYGNPKTKATFMSMTTWVEFMPVAATVRTRDRRPTVVVTTDTSPRGRWWYVHTSQETDEQYRYFDLDGGGGFSISWSGSPEKGSIVKCETVEETPGHWALTPVKELKPGEYGVFSGQVGPFAPQGQAILFDFGIDK
jgi:hypothetical protein